MNHYFQIDWEREARITALEEQLDILMREQQQQQRWEQQHSYQQFSSWQPQPAHQHNQYYQESAWQPSNFQNQEPWDEASEPAPQDIKDQLAQIQHLIEAHQQQYDRLQPQEQIWELDHQTEEDHVAASEPEFEPTGRYPLTDWSAECNQEAELRPEHPSTRTPLHEYSDYPPAHESFPKKEDSPDYEPDTIILQHIYKHLLDHGFIEEKDSDEGEERQPADREEQEIEPESMMLLFNEESQEPDTQTTASARRAHCERSDHTELASIRDPNRSYRETDEPTEPKLVPEAEDMDFQEDEIDSKSIFTTGTPSSKFGGETMKKTELNSQQASARTACHERSEVPHLQKLLLRDPFFSTKA